MNVSFKSRRFIGAVLTVVLLGFGVDQLGLVPVVTEVICSRVSCDA